MRTVWLQVVDHLLHFIEQITNWYVKLNRSRMKNLNTSKVDTQTSLSCLYEVSLLLSCCSTWYQIFIAISFEGLNMQLSTNSQIQKRFFFSLPG